MDLFHRWRHAGNEHPACDVVDGPGHANPCPSVIRRIGRPPFASSMSTAALSTLSARLLLALTLLLAPALAPWHGADGQPLRLATAWADDGDGDGGGGGNGGDASTGPYPWGDHSRPATRPARRTPKRRAPAPPPAPSDLVPNELLALNPSAAALERASALGATALETIAAGALELRVVRLRLPAGLTARNALAQLVRTDPRRVRVPAPLHAGAIPGRSRGSRALRRPGMWHARPAGRHDRLAGRSRRLRPRPDRRHGGYTGAGHPSGPGRQPVARPGVPGRRAPRSSRGPRHGGGGAAGRARGQRFRRPAATRPPVRGGAVPPAGAGRARGRRQRTGQESGLAGRTAHAGRRHEPGRAAQSGAERRGAGGRRKRHRHRRGRRPTRPPSSACWP